MKQNSQRLAQRADRWRLELDAHRLALAALDLVDDRLAVGETGLDHELVVGREELPVEEVRQLAAVHRQQLGARDDADLIADAPRLNARDANHRSSVPM